jgi:hypothetical protein
MAKMADKIRLTNLDPELESLIQIEYHRVSGKIVDIVDGTETNCLVVAVPLTHPKGEYAYYFQIRFALDYAICTGVIPTDKFVNVMARAPPQIKTLLSEQYPDWIIG